MDVQFSGQGGYYVKNKSRRKINKLLIGDEAVRGIVWKFLHLASQCFVGWALANNDFRILKSLPSQTRNLCELAIPTEECP